MSPLSALQALERLRDGNRRFVAGVRSPESVRGLMSRRELAAGQDPIAIILGCSDSRVPPEIVFDQGLGDLFVVRVAGNIAGLSEVGSIEFAAEQFGTRLVVVLGHSQCGAVMAALAAVGRPLDGYSPGLRSIIERIRPSVEGLVTGGVQHDREALLQEAVRANVRASASSLRHGSPVLGQLIEKDGLLILGAEYSLERGEVDFFDLLP